MNKEEIKHFKAMLRQGSLRHMNILLDDKFKREYKFLEWRITDLEIRYQQSIRRNEVLKRKLQEYELLLATKVEIK